MEKLRRSSKYNMVAGVAGGLAEYFEIDPLIIRLIFVLTAFWSGVGILVYLILLIVLPLEETINEPSQSDIRESSEGSANNQEKSGPPSGQPGASEENDQTKKGGVITGLILITIGVLFLLEKLVPDFYFKQFWPLLLVLIGLVLVVTSLSSDEMDNRQEGTEVNKNDESTTNSSQGNGDHSSKIDNP